MDLPVLWAERPSRKGMPPPNQGEYRCMGASLKCNFRVAGERTEEFQSDSGCLIRPCRIRSVSFHYCGGQVFFEPDLMNCYGG